MTRQSTSSKPIGVFVGAAVILGIVAVAWLAIDRGAMQPTPPPPAPLPAAESPATSATPPIDDHGHDPAVDAIPRITIEELRDEMARGAVVVIDVRTAEDYLRGHIPGALQIPLTYIAGEVDYLPRGRKIVAYCT